MAGFFYADELVIDLAAVNCVGSNYAIVGGVQIKLPERCAHDLRRQFRAYKENFDRDEKGFKFALLNRMSPLSEIATMLARPEVVEQFFGGFIAQKIKESAGVEVQ